MTFQRRRAGRASSIGPEARNEGGRVAAGDQHVAAEAAFLARRWVTSGESEEGSLLGPGNYWGLRAERKHAVSRLPGVTISAYN
jgi:hypothetical protein